jgi:hypothetical protein
MLIGSRSLANTYRICRSLGAGRLHSLYRVMRYLLTGRSGKFRVNYLVLLPPTPKGA